VTGLSTSPLATPAAPSPFQYVVLLFFEPRAEANLLALAAELRRQGLEPFPEIDNLRPHITLAAFPDPLPAALPAALRAFAAGAPPLTLHFSSLGFFPTEQRVTFLSPAPTSLLLDLQAGLLGLLHSFGVQPNHYFQAGAWVPHCTVAIQMDPRHVPLVEATCRHLEVFKTVTVASLALMGYPPPELLGEFPLGSLPETAPNTPPQ
jgi:2'-5' RNA ligase